MRRLRGTDGPVSLVEPRFEFEGRGVVEIRGKGAMDTLFLMGRRETN